MNGLAGEVTGTSGLAGALLATATGAKSGSVAPAIVNGVTTDVQVARDLTVAAGDVIVVIKIGAQWHAVARLYPSATSIPVDPTPPPPPPKAVTTTGRLVVPPVETRSYRTSGGWRQDTTEVIQGEYGGWGNHTGAVFYGRKPRSLAGATVTGATIRVRRVQGGAYAARQTTLRLVTQSTRPAGAPTLTSTTTGPSIAVGKTTTFDVPVAWVQSMVDGTSGGLAVFDAGGNPYVRYAGRGEWSAAWTLTINWIRG